MSFHLGDYLHKIGLKERPVHLEGLFSLQRAQFFKIPFENLDIQLGRAIDLSPAVLMQKLIYEQRGGYCFELNGLLLLALQALGYQARSLLARVHTDAVPSGRTHQIIEVIYESECWILDAGFGAGGPRMPLKLIENQPAEMGSFRYRFHRDERWGYVLETWEAGVWKPSYSFDLSHVTVNDLALGNFYTSHATASHFTQIRTVSLPTEKGRVSLRNFTLTRVEDGVKFREEIQPGSDYIQVLKKIFGIVLDAPYEALKPIE